MNTEYLGFIVSALNTAGSATPIYTMVEYLIAHPQVSDNAFKPLKKLRDLKLSYNYISKVGCIFFSFNDCILVP